MNFLKNIILFSLLCIIPSIHSIGSLSNFQFPPHETAELAYSISTIEKPITDEDIQLDEPIEIYERKYSNTYNSGKTRSTITASTKNNHIILTIATWTTKNQSYLTFNNLSNFLIANWFLNNPAGIFTPRSENYTIPLIGGLLVGTHIAADAWYHYSRKDIMTIAENIADTIRIEKTTLGDIAEHKNMISTEDLSKFIVKNKENWTNIPIIKITAKFSKDATQSFVILHIKDYNYELQTSHSLELHKFIDDPIE